MDKYDPQKNVALMLDEWGTWWDTEPGTNPGHLYQQNTLRDAFVASVSASTSSINIPNRLKMANIAQIVNVLQSMILTSGKTWYSPHLLCIQNVQCTPGCHLHSLLS